MHYFNLYSSLFTVGFCSLALAQTPNTHNPVIAAIIYGLDDSELKIPRGRCIKVEKIQPKISSIQVAQHNICRLYYNDLDCTGTFFVCKEGGYNIERTRIKSIRCTASRAGSQP